MCLSQLFKAGSIACLALSFVEEMSCVEVMSHNVCVAFVQTGQHSFSDVVKIHMPRMNVFLRGFIALPRLNVFLRGFIALPRTLEIVLIISCV